MGLVKAPGASSLSSGDIRLHSVVSIVHYTMYGTEELYYILLHETEGPSPFSSATVTAGVLAFPRFGGRIS